MFDYKTEALSLIDKLKANNSINNIQKGVLRRAILEKRAGFWIVPYKKQFGKCSQCKVVVMIEETELYDYCPYCGSYNKGDNE